MAKQPEDLVLKILRNIQDTLADHTRRFDGIERRLDELEDGGVAALGLATRANVRHEAVDRRLHELQTRMSRCEKKR
jgi:hypothetical protein